MIIHNYIDHPPRFRAGRDFNPTEVLLIRMAYDGWSNGLIAQHFETSEQVIKNKFKKIYEQLGFAGISGGKNVNLRVLLARWWAEEGRQAVYGDNGDE